MIPTVVPQLLANNGRDVLRRAIADPDRYASEARWTASTVLVVYHEGTPESRNRKGRLEGTVLEDRTSPYRGRSRSGWAKVKHRSWYEREGWRFDRRGRSGAADAPRGRQVGPTFGRSTTEEVS